MDSVSTPEGLERMMQKVELSHIMALLVNSGAVPQQAAIGYFVTLADMTRDAKVVPALQPYADRKALHYEDMGNMMRGGSLLPREPRA